MSVGGFMADELALRHPERIAELVLMATQADAYTSEERHTFGGLLEPLDTEGPIPEHVIEAFRPVIFGKRPSPSSPTWSTGGPREWRRRPARSLHGEYRSWIDKPDRLADLAQIAVPVLVVHGEGDNGITVDTRMRCTSDCPTRRSHRSPTPATSSPRSSPRRSPPPWPTSSTL